MPIPRSVAQFNKRAFNKVSVHVAPVLPGFGVVTHRGRRSGTVYRTPVDVFVKPDHVTIALTYGADSDWVRNVLAAGGCDVRTRGKDLHLTNPRVVHDETRADIRPVERVVLGWLNVSDFLVLDR
jgi:deazaflavin-dependent oxidoreductase (nitroreductase family)